MNSDRQPPRITIADAGQHAGETVEIAGWLYNLRKSGKIVFPILRDGTGIMQCVAVKSHAARRALRGAQEPDPGISLIVTGKVRAEPRAPGGFELDVENRRGAPARAGGRSLSHHAQGARHRLPDGPPPPVAAQPAPARHHARPPRGDQGHPRLLRLATASSWWTRRSSPRPPAKAPPRCSRSNYFDDEKVYLTQSGQLYNEATAMAFGKVYCFGPTFRAEKSKTRRHLTEFWMVEPEMAYATLEDVKRVGRGAGRVHRAAACWRTGAHELEGPGARRLQAGSRSRRRSRASATTRR